MFGPVEWEYQGFKLQRRDEGTLYICWNDPAKRGSGQRRRSTRTTDFQLAQAALIEFVEQQKQPENEGPESVLLTTVLRRYWNDHAKKRQSSEEAIFYHLKIWTEYWKSETTIADLKHESLEAFTNWLRNRKKKDGQAVSSSYVNRVLTTGIAALNLARKREWVNSVPSIEKIPVPTKRKERLTIDELAALLDAAHEVPYLWNYLLIALNTGGRPEAILELTRKQIDFEDKLIHFNADGRVQTRKFRATVPITDTLLPHLRNMGPGYLVHRDGKQIKRLRKSFRTAVRKAEIEKSITPKGLQHTIATLLRSEGVGPWELAAFTGHKLPGMAVTEIYAEGDPESLRRSVVPVLDRLMKQINEKADHKFAVGLVGVRDTRVTPER